MLATNRTVLRSRSTLAVLSAILLMPCLSLLAVEPPSKPFLDKNSFYLSSAGFKVHFANDTAGKKPLHCVCTFIGTKDAYQSYRAILAQPIAQPDDISPDYRTQVSSVLEGDPVDMLGNPPYAAEYFHNYY